VRLYEIRILEKLKKKNLGNSQLNNAIDKLVDTIEKGDWKSPLELVKDRTDADCVHSEGFYFFNIKIHRILLLIEFEEDRATVVWAGSHADYEITFKNNRKVIEKWLKLNNWI